jgi:hypothetical protein
MKELCESIFFMGGAAFFLYKLTSIIIGILLLSYGCYKLIRFFQKIKILRSL